MVIDQNTEDYSDLFLIPNSEREGFPTPKHQKDLEHCFGLYPACRHGRVADCPGNGDRFCAFY